MAEAGDATPIISTSIDEIHYITGGLTSARFMSSPASVSMRYSEASPIFFRHINSFNVIICPIINNIQLDEPLWRAVSICNAVNHVRVQIHCTWPTA